MPEVHSGGLVLAALRFAGKFDTAEDVSPKRRASHAGPSSTHAYFSQPATTTAAGGTYAPPLPTLSLCESLAHELWSLLSVVHPNPRVAARTSMPSASAAAAATGSTAAASTAPSGASAAKPSMPPSVSTEYAYIPPKAHASTTPASAPAGTGEETTSRCYVVAVKHL